MVIGMLPPRLAQRRPVLACARADGSNSAGAAKAGKMAREKDIGQHLVVLIRIVNRIFGRDRPATARGSARHASHGSYVMACAGSSECDMVAHADRVTGCTQASAGSLERLVNFPPALRLLVYFVR
jgi:hypothetical protein